MGLAIEFVEAERFDGIWHLPAAGHADVAIGGITNGARRERIGTSWSAPYFKVRRTMVFNKYKPLSAFPDGVEGEIRATPGTTGHADALHRLKATGKEAFLKDSNDDEDDIEALLEGRVQAVVRGSFVGRAIVARMPDKLAMLPPWDIAPHLTPSTAGEVFCFPTREGSGLAEALSAYLAHISRRGVLQNLLQKYDLISQAE